ncbi:hypothetical protein AMK26_32115 [Streptomyces sp. CB03234]|nr:hypothetical protein [Streptomyces sp. CB03234]OKJ95206.1 hypothetical protein AMK26_32115 [Streptomyces sp. CB03234]
MVSKTLARGMGTFFKDCEHPRSRWSKCPHLYKVRYRDAAGKQVEESGFATQDEAIQRLTDVYNAKKAAPRGRAKAERVAKYGAMRFGEYAAEWKAGQRDLAPASMRHADWMTTTRFGEVKGYAERPAARSRTAPGGAQTAGKGALTRCDATGVVGVERADARMAPVGPAPGGDPGGPRAGRGQAACAAASPRYPAGCGGTTVTGRHGPGARFRRSAEDPTLPGGPGPTLGRAPASAS